MVLPRDFHGRLERDHFAQLGGFDRDPAAAEPAMSGWKPGDRRPDPASMLRVNQAGEYGATRIYAGQLAVIGQDRPAGRVIARMASQERRHLERFDAMMAERGVRPTALQPLWKVAGFALGAATALLSERAAMACTDAVETEIDRHYGRQLDELGDTDPELAADIADFRAEELEHRDTAREHGAAEAMGYPLLTAAIRAGCRLAIGLSKRI
jgi:ubiquinone biosynthesis monooxygenase Coq7